MFVDIFNSLAEMGNFAGFITLAITILGAISLFLANMGRYIQAKKFGIPLRAVHQANISDSADLWVALVGALGFGVFIPVIMLNMDVSRWVLLIVVFAAFVLGLFSTKSNTGFSAKKRIKRDGNEYYVYKSITMQVFAGFALAGAIAYLHLFNIYVAEADSIGGFFAMLRMFIAVGVQGIYVLLLLLLLLTNVYRRLFGSGDIMTTVIDGQTYLAAMRHSLEKWILLPCDIEDYLKKKEAGRYMGKIVGEGIEYSVKNALFTRGSFIIKDLSTLPEPITYRTNFGVVEKAQRIQDNDNGPA